VRSRRPGGGIAAMSCKVAQVKENENGAMLLLEHYMRSSGEKTIEGLLEACRLRCADGRV
jgi:hypothetical protein